MRIAIDTGGTFTDCVYLEGGELRVLKLPSTPADPGLAIRAAVARIAPGAPLEVRHGTTVATNTLLEGTGARVAWVTTAGFEDTLAIGRQNRPGLYTWGFPPRRDLAPPELRFGVPERLNPDGSVHTPLNRRALDALVNRIAAAHPQAIAVSLLFAFANPAHEEQVRLALLRLEVPVSLSSRVLPEFREYERGATVLLNAYLAPRLGAYLGRLAEALPGARLQVMQSAGGIISAALAAEQPVRTILSGPAGGVVGAQRVAHAAGFDRLLTFDMGGTSTDVALIAGPAGLRTTTETRLLDLPVAVPMLDIHTVGAGGGSLAGFDAGGALRVGPQSAGADPGPACYGRGSQPTVTDANLLLGRLDTEGLLGGGFKLDIARARAVFEAARGPLPSVEAFADGILRVAEATMEKALRLVSLERGHDPRDLTLVAFGGAGPLHAAALARSLAIPRVLVPPMPGALSALGILMSDTVTDHSRTVMRRISSPATAANEWRACEPVFRQLEREGRDEMLRQGLEARALRSLDLRYQGQGFEINLDESPTLLDDFHAAHRRRFGFADPARAVEIVSLRVRMVAASPPLPWGREPFRPGRGRAALRREQPVWFAGDWQSTPVYDRACLRAGDLFSGPALITEYSATTLVPPYASFQVDANANLILELTP